MSTSREAIAAMEGPAALPRKNGELVFEAPWQGRLFGLAVALSERGFYDWDAFREQLIDRVSAAEAPYYEQFLAALEKVAVGRGLVTPGELDSRRARIAAEEGEDDHHD